MNENDAIGITLDDIKARCLEEGNCWIWQGATSYSAAKRHWGTPCISVKVGVGKRKTVAVRRLVWVLDRGRPVPPGRSASPACGNNKCVSPECAKALTRKESAQAAAKFGAFSNAAKIKKATATNRARSWITDEIVAAVKAARTAKEAHEQTGVSWSHCKAIRRGAARVDFSPFAGLFTGLAMNDSTNRRAA